MESRKILFIDFTYYIGLNDKAVIKEFVCMNLNGDFGFHEILSPPYPKNLLSNKDQETNNWCHENCGLVSWEHGIKPYVILKDICYEIVRYNPEIIFVKGPAKYTYLTSLFTSELQEYNHSFLNGMESIIIEMESRFINIPSLKKLRTQFPTLTRFGGSCYFHNDNCSLLNVKLLIHWFFLNDRNEFVLY